MWCLADENFLKLIDWIREGSGVPIIINNSYNGGPYNESGLRINVDSIVAKKTKNGSPYLSAHCYFKAGDLKPSASSGKSAEWLFDWIYKNRANAPCDFRMESKPDTIYGQRTPWVHVDTFIEQNNPAGKKDCYVFKA
ncbi:MAG: hypothetical protein ACRC92_27320 [Peptostreptococcaceae bacterium]